MKRHGPDKGLELFSEFCRALYVSTKEEIIYSAGSTKI